MFVKKEVPKIHEEDAIYMLRPRHSFFFREIISSRFEDELLGKRFFDKNSVKSTQTKML